MILNVKFSESNQSFNPQFGEIHNISDGGFERGYAEGYEVGNAEGYTKGHTEGMERGYAEGYAEGRDIWNYVRSISGAFQKNTFPTGTNFVLNVPNLSLSVNEGNLNYTFRSTTGLESIILKCTTRGVAMHAHGAFSRCSDLKFLDLSEFNTTFGVSTDVFYSCSKLEEIRGEIENTTTNWTLWFASCVKLREVRFKANSIKGAFTIAQSPLLSAESVQSIVDGLADMTGGTSYKLDLHADVKAKLTEEQLATIAAKNWTMG